jgi:undecaprenyl-diphosphatase
MNEYLYGLILGLIQGLTEFLPVSSSGHLAFAESLGVGSPDLCTNLLLHVATLAAVVAAYRKQIAELLKHPLSDKGKFILTATIPTGVIAAAIRYFFEQETRYLPFCFALTSVILLLPKIIKPRNNGLYEKNSLRKAVIVGAAQGIACLNGVSRSGSTVVALRLCGAEKEESAEMSFLLSIPVIVGSALVEILTNRQKLQIGGGVILAMFVAFIVGFFAIKAFSAIMKKDRLHWFSIYTFAMAIAVFVTYAKQ